MATRVSLHHRVLLQSLTAMEVRTYIMGIIYCVKGLPSLQFAFMMTRHALLYHYHIVLWKLIALSNICQAEKFVQEVNFAFLASHKEYRQDNSIVANQCVSI